MDPPLTLNAWLRFDAIGRLLEEEPEGLTFVEVGPGVGSISYKIARRFSYVGYEPDRASFLTARRRLVGRGEVFNEALPAEPPQAYDVLGAFEVLEHIEDDLGTLRQWSRWLAPRGRLLLSVPAGPDRFGASDVAVGHWRRYSRRSLEDVLREAGFTDVEILACGFPAGNALELLRGILARYTPELSRDDSTARSGRLHQPADWMAPLFAGLAFPMRVLQRPFFGTELGNGLVARAHKPGRDA